MELIAARFNCELLHTHPSSAVVAYRPSITGSGAMSGQRRLSREGIRKPSNRSTDFDFGLIALGLLAVAAIVVAWKFPELQLQYAAGP
jgi:hypothetical protein